MKRKIQKRVSENKFLLGFIDFKKILFFLKKNFILAIFILCIGLVGLIAFYKIFLSKPTYVYVKVRVGQGLWWASTQRPGTWFIHAIKNTKAQLDLTGKPIAEVLDVYYYPYWGGNQYDVYVTLRLKVTKVGATGVYNYNRETIGVSAPIDLEFSNTQFSGTIITLTETPIQEQYIDKIVYVSKKYAYPWEYDQILIGDSLSNGKEKVFEILEKAKGETNEIIFNDFGKFIPLETESYKYIYLKAKLRVKLEDKKYIYAEEMVISPGRGLNIATNNLTFNDYIITRVE